MGKRLSKIYTRTGDDGETGLGDGSRIKKTHPRVEAIGSVDELNSIMGVVVEGLILESFDELTDIANFMRSLQHRIFDLGGELSIPGFEIVNKDHVIA
ncbi:MAG: ATP:cob(I)alamin adenosyltransferase, partial [Gammaproteobacteria bacterium]|nr:ATP:cob(I)alamin adenosyltransferase [Gammaproteobacteria bacterium]